MKAAVVNPTETVKWLASALLCFFSSIPQQARAQPSALDPGTPHLEKRGNATQLIVDGKPFLILGGELHNSSSSSIAYMKPIWPRLAAMHLNTVVLPVAWETVEPEEGKFDYTALDGLLEGARQNKLKLVILWFGSWKNTYSSYLPAWVKKNPARFPRVQTIDGKNTERLSPFSTQNRDADLHAFAAVMHHLREVDSREHTVVLVQVENEVGVIPESRDHSSAANAEFAAAVPASLMSYMQQHKEVLVPEFRAVWENHGSKPSGTWQEVFGKDPLTDDFFMAWHYAAYIDRITVAGKAEYPLPMFANAALIRPNYQPGQYNSGGPLPHSLNIWRAGAPAIDFLSPDIYFNEFSFWAQAYSRPDNPLFVPETQGGSAGAANALYAFGQLSAIGFCPFGIDDEKQTPIDLAGIPGERDRSDATAIGNVYATLSKLAPMLLEKRAEGATAAAVMEGDAQRAARISLGSYTMSMTRSGATEGNSSTAPRVAALFIQTGPEEYIVAGIGNAQITFAANTAGPPTVGIDSIDEEFFDGGKLIPGRRLNGDENSQGQSLRLNASDSAEGRVYRVRLYRY